ncbi:hypothetical protein JCM16303_001196 [Sporobolomyces ruberrimus]
MQRSRPQRHVARAPSSCSSPTSLYSYPLSTDTLPVYEQLTLAWDPSCVEISGSSTIDLYLNVQQETGLVAVHEWTGVNYAQGKLVTMLKPSWWNASTGAGTVQAQWSTYLEHSCTDSYPSVTESAPQAVYTGPSVESVSDKNNPSSPTGGKLGVAIAVPLIFVALLAIAYVSWNRFKKRPQKKRFSAVVDKRMSMISQGTWQPRPSMAASRPGSSFHPTHRPSGSMYSTGNRHSYFADPNQRNSTYSALNAGAGGGSPLRPPAPAEMRQRGIGEGDRISRVSFAGGERPSFSSSRAATGGGGGKTGSVYTRTSLHQSQLSRSQNDPTASSPPRGSPPLSRSSPPQFSSSTSPPALTSSTSTSSFLSNSSRFEDPISRSESTREELLRDSPSVNQLRQITSPFPPSHSHKPSMTSSLRIELSSSITPSPASQTTPIPSDPFSSSSFPTSTSRPKLSPLATNNSFLSSPNSAGSENEILSPDQALASYSFTRALSPNPPPSAEEPPRSTSVKLGLGKMLKKFKSTNSLKSKGGGGGGIIEEEKEKESRERSMSPFEDPRNVVVVAERRTLPPMTFGGDDDWDGSNEKEKEEEGDEYEREKEEEGRKGELSWKGGKAF